MFLISNLNVLCSSFSPLLLTLSPHTSDTTEPSPLQAEHTHLRQTLLISLVLQPPDQQCPLLDSLQFVHVFLLFGCSKEQVCGCCLGCRLTRAKSRRESLFSASALQDSTAEVKSSSSRCHWWKSCTFHPTSNSGCHSFCFKFSASRFLPSFLPLFFPQHVFTTSSYVIFETSWNINAQSWRISKMGAFKKLTD